MSLAALEALSVGVIWIKELRGKSQKGFEFILKSWLIFLAWYFFLPGSGIWGTNWEWEGWREVFLESIKKILKKNFFGTAWNIRKNSRERLKLRKNFELEKNLTENYWKFLKIQKNVETF